MPMRMKSASGAYARAEALLEEHKDKLAALAAMLIEKETMDGREVEELLGLGRKEEA